ncbi:hypothetical protein GCM10027614_83170 [Micromonospora vulcania]
MIYTGAPQNTRRKPIEELNIEAGLEHMKAHDMADIVVHAPYIINIGNSVKPETFELGVNFLQSEIERTRAWCQANRTSSWLMLAKGQKGIKQIIQGLNEALIHDQDVQIALETMAGKGSECGRTFEEIAQIIDGVTHNELLSVTFDTCHTHDARLRYCK